MDETDNDVETFVLNEYMYNASVFVEGFSTDDGWPMERYTTPGFPERLNELIVAICELLDQSNEDLLAEYGVFLISI